MKSDPSQHYILTFQHYIKDKIVIYCQLIKYSPIFDISDKKIISSHKTIQQHFTNIPEQ